MRKHLFVTLLLACGMPLTGSFAAYAAPEPQSQGQAVQTITGSVLDENNEPVIGASVYEKGVKSNAAATNFDGNFTLRVRPGATLVVSYVGYKTVEIAAAQGMTVYLQPTTEMLNELVAIGYGTQKRANLTGAVATVDVARVMDSRSTTDVTKALQGAVPGLTITNTSGAINGTPQIKIRGTGTFSTGNADNQVSSNPLIVVDGVVTEDLSFIDPNDIAEISVLKDAASASIYGTRAAFGVILITTKSPSTQDRVSVSYSNNFGWSQATKLADYPSVPQQVAALTQGNLMSGGEVGLFGMDPYELMPLAEQWYREHGGKKADYREMVAYSDPANIGDFKYIPQLDDKGNPTGAMQGLYYADWDVKGIMFNNAAPSNHHNVSLEGTSGKTQYRASFGYSHRQSLHQANPDNMYRYNAMGSLTTEIFKWWKAGFRVSFSEKDLKAVYNTRGDYIYMWRWGSYFGPYGWIRDAEGTPTDFRNDIAYRKQGGPIKDSATETRMTAFMDFNPVNNLNIHADFTYDVQNLLNTTAYMPMYAFNSWGAIQEPEYIVPVSWADARQTNTKVDQWSMNVYGTYDLTVAKDFNFRLMLGATAEQQDYNYLYAKRDELLDLNLPYLGLTTGGSNKTGYSIDNTISHWATAGFFGRFNFDYKGIYLFEFNGRYDGSSKFPENDQWAFFPSGSIGYRFSEENYFKPLKAWWSNAKVRASYGTVGNTAVGDYRFLSVVNSPLSLSYLINNSQVQYASMPTLVSNSLTWERVTTADVGFDFGFLSNSLNVSFDWYQRKTTDMLAPGAQLPAVLGANAPYGNNGTLNTRGWELSLSWNHSFGDADVYATASIADARTKIEKWHNDTGKLYSWNPYQTDYTEGEYYGDIWGFETERYFTADDFNADGSYKAGVPSQKALESGTFHYQAGDVKFADLNDDGVINFGDPTMVDKDGKEIPTGTQRNHGDLKKIGNAMPRYEYSFRLGGAWKGFDIDAFFQGVGKRDMWMTSAFVVPFARGTDAIYTGMTSYNSYELIRNDQTKAYELGAMQVNQDNFYPRLYPGAGGQGRMSGINQGRYNFYPQTRYLMNMAYLRFKTLTVGYTLPADLTRKALIQKARIYFSADNLALLYNGMKDYPIDPEITTGGNGKEAQMSGNGYFGRTDPMMRTYSFGIQVTF